MPTLNPYLNFAGNTEEAFKFYKSVFGGEFLNVTRFKDMPPDAPKAAENEREMIMHIALPIGKGNVLMGTDTLESMGHKLTVGNNFSITIKPESREEADKLFKGLSEGGTVAMPMADAFWGAYFGMFTDKFGIQWMINLDNQPAK
ncbi:MAG: VOC family protein [Ignavibacteriae bacterium]|nr:VOC family protein [Ignavibacteriota bacterium]